MLPKIIKIPTTTEIAIFEAVDKRKSKKNFIHQKNNKIIIQGV